ncbi:hypothetical protein Leryth_008639 [Lithospermum erythrorhizon]|nr:hypothetical protein Leryth_008639 [Lithospermum erythrorhizon]
MVPIRGMKKRKSDEKDVMPPLPPPVDWWDDFSRRLHGQSKDQVTFESFFKISRKTFDYICSLVGKEMMVKSVKNSDFSGTLLTSKDRVAIALRRLSSGESLSLIGEELGVHRSTVSKITWQFVEVMEEKGLHHLRWPSTVESMEEIKINFEKIWGLPNCCGAIDATHIVFGSNLSDSSNHVWCDQEKNCSMLLQAIVDPELRFLDIVTGWPGSLTNSQLLRGSTFHNLAEEGNRLNGRKLDLSDKTELREYIIGDPGFPLLPWLLTPYQGRGLSDVQCNFNKRLKETHKVAQRALAKLKETWKIIHGTMWRPAKNHLPRVILVCCILHNILIDLQDKVQSNISFSEDHDPSYLQQVSDCTDEAASTVREKLALHL